MRIAIVGVCGSGKSTISKALQARGFDAYVVGQEHSQIADLWRRRHPDALVFLDATLDTVRERRGVMWPEWLYELQVDRLADARSAASVVVNTGAIAAEGAARIIARELSEELQ